MCRSSVYFQGTGSRSSRRDDEGRWLLSAGGDKEGCGRGADGRDGGGAATDVVRPGSGSGRGSGRGSDGAHHHPQVGFTLEYSMRSIVRVPIATVKMSGRAMS